MKIFLIRLIINLLISGWLDLDFLPAGRQGAGRVGKERARFRHFFVRERRSRPERRFATLGQNERTRENQVKTGPAKLIIKL